jgi:hypothetical protein
MSSETNIPALLIGGGLTVAGVVIGQVFGLVSGYIERIHQSAVRKKERLEKMTELVSASLVWFMRLSNCRTMNELQASPPPPEVRLIAMYARLSFPALVGPSTDYANQCHRHYCFAADCFNPQIPASVGAQMVLAQKANPELAKNNDLVLEIRNRLDNAIADEAKKYLHV